MANDFDVLWSLYRRTFASPEDGIQGVFDLELDRKELWLALVLTTSLSVLLLTVTQGVQLVLPLGPSSAVAVGPMTYGVIVGSFLIILVFAISFVGQALGGQGGIRDTIAVVVWFEALGLILQLVQTFTTLLGASAVAMVSLIGTIYLFWCLIRFITVLHGFETSGRSVLTVFLSFMGIAFGLVLIYSVFGTSVAGGVANV